MTRPFVLGLTGSIGMGKSTTAAMFAAAGCDVWDADKAVHRLYAKGGGAVAPFKELREQAVTDGAVSRPALRTWIAEDPTALAAIEKIVHPLVAQDRARFMETSSADIVVLDIPLLFENDSAGIMDAVVVVTAPADVQKRRVLARAEMTPEQLAVILDKQMPDAEKRRRADFVVETVDIATAKAAVGRIVELIRSKHA